MSTAKKIVPNLEAANDELALDQLVTKLVDAIDTRCVPLDIALWDTEHLAAYLCYQPRVIREKVVTQYGFPQRIDIGNGRWKASEVIEWAMSKQRVDPYKNK